ncbi:MAG: hypothetical protein WHV66_03555 [Anaerolineales bacterium]|jgi:hypothetical protein
MEELLRFLATYELWIYILLGGAGVICLRRLIIAWREWHSTVFGLERENAQRRFSMTLSVTIVLALFAVSEFVLVSFVVPLYPQTFVVATPTLNILTTPTLTSGLGMSPEPVNKASNSNLSSQGCMAGQVEWTSPQPGEEISGSVELRGTVNLPDLAFYKYEFSQPGSDTWTTLAGGNMKKVDEVLGTWNTSGLAAGDYRLRLIVYNTQNQMLPACEILVRVTTAPE